ncbi:MAG: YgiQ family radical SAM protein, partial [Clostridia bacterium]|nr:YgiQ family radical SAM protein [Clostridia bacterium]
MSYSKFLPICREDMEQRKIEQLDFVYVCGDAYVDHPSFGHAIITRVLESAGYTVGIIPQPDWHSAEDFKRLGKPKYAFLVSSGNIDSMVNHYTAARKKRSNDLYTPGGAGGKRPDRAVIVYCNRIKEAYSDVPIIIGGIEASLRRFAHYDYWDNKVRRSVMFDSRADVLTYGMGEKIILQLADSMRDGIPLDQTFVDGCCYNKKDISDIGDYIELPSMEQVRDDKRQYCIATKIQYENQDPIRGKTLVQKHGDRYLVATKPMMPLNTAELDAVYALPYAKTYHPIYEKDGGVPAIDEVKFSVTNNRGCYGSCNFCALTFHQGRIVQTRSEKSVIDEVVQMTKHKDFKGYIHDVGGPTANFYGPSCGKQLKHGTCKGKQCLFPQPCKNLEISHTKYMQLLRKLRAIPGVKKVFIRSGIRYDYLINDKDDTFFYDLCKHHISGQLKVAPEHVSDNVLNRMGKPSRQVYDKFCNKFYQINQRLGKKQYLVPYLMSSHPGSTINDAIELALYLKAHHMHPEQVQDFYHTPFTLSTCMFYTGMDPLTMEEVYVPRDMNEKQMQRALLQFDKPENQKTVIKALQMAGREDLIGYSPNCLVRPLRQNGRGNAKRYN